MLDCKMQSSNSNATDSVWSQQFLFDYFSSPSSKKEKKEGIRPGYQESGIDEGGLHEKRWMAWT